MIFPGLLWFALADGLPGLWTSAFGREFEETVVATTHRYHARYECDYKIWLPSARPVLGSEECIRKAFYLAHPEEAVRVRLIGKRSMFGASVRRIRYVGEATTPAVAKGASLPARPPAPRR